MNVGFKLLKRKEYFIYFLIISIIIILSPVISFIINFYNFPISSDSSKWSEFATIVSLSLSTANLFVFILITIYIKNIEHERHKQTINLQKPVLSFYTEEIGQNLYKLKNVGLGPALNIVIYMNTVEDKDLKSDWYYRLTLYSLASNENQSINKSKNKGVSKLMAIYSDVLGITYRSILENNKTTVIICEKDFKLPTADNVDLIWKRNLT